MHYELFFVTLHLKSDAIVAQLVEHWLPKPRVAGSSPVYRSKLKHNTSPPRKIPQRGLTIRIYYETNNY